MITVKSQFAFFDSPKVKRSVDWARIRTLAEAGGYARTVAKNSIKTRKKQSKPGTPPSSHSGGLKRNIFFGYDKNRDSALVGPLKFKKGSIPQVLEHGGITTVVRRNKSTGKLERKQIKIKSRPYMNPALLKTVPVFPGMFKDSLKGTTSR